MGVCEYGPDVLFIHQGDVFTAVATWGGIPSALEIVRMISIARTCVRTNAYDRKYNAISTVSKCNLPVSYETIPIETLTLI